MKKEITGDQVTDGMKVYMPNSRHAQKVTVERNEDNRLVRIKTDTAVWTAGFGARVDIEVEEEVKSDG